MRRRTTTNPVDYDKLCKQTVTVYHQEYEKFTRTVYHKAFLDYKKTQSVDQTGSKEANSFLLVIPGSTQAAFVGDKVYDGTGPEITTQKEWAAFRPPAVSGLVVVSYADAKKWNGMIVHTEAGG